MNCLIAFVLAAFVSPVHASLVHVSSLYQDIGNAQRQLKVGGSGYLFTSGARQFVFTASHVSQGASGLTVTFGAQPLQIVGRALSGTNDLELIEVSGADPTQITGKDDGQGFYEMVPVGQRRRWIDSYNFVSLNDEVVDPNLDADNTLSKSRPTVLGMDYFSEVLHGDTLVQPGTSGAPLITITPDPAAWKASTAPYDFREGFQRLPPGKSLVRGIAIRRERFFSQAAFVTNREMRDLFTSYMASQPPKATVRWTAQGALLYRISLDGSLRETTTFAASTAGGTVVDSGNGMTVDGGNLGSLSEDTPKAFLAQVSAFPSYDGSPQVYWMLAMRHPTTSALISFWSWFDMEFYPFLSNFMFATHQAEGPHMDLVSQLGPRFGKSGNFEVTSPQYLRVDEAGVYVKLQLAGGDMLAFQLNREGVLCENGTCPDHFIPVIEVPSASGQVYLVDVHQLFFADSGRSMMPQFRDPKLGDVSDQLYYKMVYDDLAKEVARPTLYYRKRRADLSQAMRLDQGLESSVNWGPP